MIELTNQIKMMLLFSIRIKIREKVVNFFVVFLKFNYILLINTTVGLTLNEKPKIQYLYFFFREQYLKKLYLNFAHIDP